MQDLRKHKVNSTPKAPMVGQPVLVEYGNISSKLLPGVALTIEGCVFMWDLGQN